MKSKFNMQRVRDLALLAAIGLAGAAQAAVPAAVSDAVDDGVTDILAVVALGGAAFITISSSGVIWNVASKFIKRLGGKA